MNIRSLIKLNKFELDTNVKRSSDNHHQYKLEIWHGDNERFHESTCFTKKEFESLLCNIKALHNSIMEQLDAEKENQSGAVIDC